MPPKVATVRQAASDKLMAAYGLFEQGGRRQDEPERVTYASDRLILGVLGGKSAVLKLEERCRESVGT